MEFFTRNSLFLCIDQGGHASRAIVFNHEGEMVCSAYSDVETQHPGKDYVEYQASDILQSVNNCIQQVLEKLADRKKHIIYAGLATQRSNVVCWDRETGAALSPVISWQDRRNSEYIKKLNDKNEHIHKITGLFLSPHYGASKLRWCLDNIPEVKDALNENKLALGPMSSFISFNLVQEKKFFTDPVNASRTQLYNLKQHQWDNELLTLFDIPESALPQCVPSLHQYGHIRNNNVEIPLRLVTGDQSAAMYAFGQLQPNTAYINTGTGAFLSRSCGQLALYSRRLLTSIIFQDQADNKLRNHYVLEGTVNGAGSALEWLNKQYPDEHLFNYLPDWLEQVESPPLFFNGISGLAAPFWIADFESTFSREASLPEKAVAIIESIVFLLKANFDEMGKLSSPPEQIQISGGIATLEGLNQRLADITALPVYRPADCEATARGTAYLLADQPVHWPEQGEGNWLYPAENTALLQRYQNWTTEMKEQMRD